MLEVDSLDKLLINYDIDFIKLDAEGADYEILQGAKKSLNQCLGIVVECQFFERYLNTKSFSEIEILMSPTKTLILFFSFSIKLKM